MGTGRRAHHQAARQDLDEVHGQPAALRVARSRDRRKARPVHLQRRSHRDLRQTLISASPPRQTGWLPLSPRTCAHAGMVHDEKDFYKAQLLIRMFDDPRVEGHFPRPFGVFYETDRPCYEDVMAMQIEEAIASKGKGDLDKLLRGKEVWEII